MNLHRLFGVSIAAVMAIGGITWYVRQETQRLPLVASTQRLKGFDQTTGVYILRRGSQVLGIGKLAFASVGARSDTLSVLEDTRLRVPIPGGSFQDVRQMTSVSLDAGLQVTHFKTSISTGGGETSAAEGPSGAKKQESQIEGRRISRDSMEFLVTSGTHVDTQRRAIPSDFIIGQSLWPRLAVSGTLLTGQRFQITDFDPVTLGLREVRVRIVSADSVLRATLPDVDTLTDSRRGWMRVYRIEEESQGMKTTTFVRGDGLPLRATLPAGITMTQSTNDSIKPVLVAWGKGELAPGGDTTSLIQVSAIRAGAPVGAVGRMASLRVNVRGVPEDADLQGGTQQWNPKTGELKVRVGALGEMQITGADKWTAADTAAEPFVQSRDPRIRREAARLTAGMTSKRDQVVAVTAWVWKVIDKQYVASLPDALQVLETRQGDCTEHTVLTVALLRSLGIPARPVSGLAYVQGSWFFHAWVEVNLGQGWEPVDPTFGEAPASAGRIRLFIGRGGMSKIAGVIGSLDLQVLEATPLSRPAKAPRDPAGRMPKDPAGRLQNDTARRGNP